MEIESENVSQDELNAEQAALAESTEDDIRAQVIAELGISADENPELVEKLVKREVAHKANLSKAISQKIKYRTLATGDKKPVTPTTPTVPATPLTPEQVRQQVVEEFETRELNALPYSDSIKEQVKKVSKLQNVPISVAAKDPYITSLVETETRNQRVNDAAKNGANRTKAGVVIDTSKPFDPKDFDFSTAEGRKAWDEAKTARRSSQQS